MCTNIHLLTLVICVYHVTAGVPSIRNILTGDRSLQELKAEKRQDEMEPDFDHEV